MSNYERPIVLANDELSEGVFAASGAAGIGCWDTGITSVQSWNGQQHIFEVSGSHVDTDHMSSSQSMAITFSGPVQNVQVEGNVVVDRVEGNVVYVTRNLHGEHAGEEMTFKIWVAGSNQAETEALTATGCGLTGCEHENH